MTDSSKKEDTKKAEDKPASEPPKPTTQDSSAKSKDQSKSSSQKLSFEMYAHIRHIPLDRRKAMKLFPKAAKVGLALADEWDAIFKEF